MGMTVVVSRVFFPPAWIFHRSANPSRFATRRLRKGQPNANEAASVGAVLLVLPQAIQLLRQTSARLDEELSQGALQRDRALHSPREPGQMP